jgi:hypothetical protein
MVTEYGHGRTYKEIADGLNEDCVAVPRDGAFSGGHMAPNGYNLPTEPPRRDRWIADTVAAVLASPEADPANSYAAARAKLDSDISTTITHASPDDPFSTYHD